jgi:2-hydroxy-6-oxonona-2,4-dienedioate hydrolase
MFATRPQNVHQTRHEQRDVDVLGLRVRYIDVGERTDEPPLLLLHGLASRLEEYEELVPHLARRRRILVLDLPGSGYSDKPARPYDLRFLEDSALAFLDALGVRRATVGGGSLGGNLTLRLGHREPERFSRLAAWAPAGVWDPKPWLLFVDRALRFLRRPLFWPMLRIQSRFWYRHDLPERNELLAQAFAYFREVYSDGFRRMYYDLGADQMRHSLFPFAREIRQPTLLLWGDQDHALGMGVGVKKLATMLPRVRLHVFEGARHALANEVPVELARQIDAHLAAPGDALPRPRAHAA